MNIPQPLAKRIKKVIVNNGMFYLFDFTLRIIAY